MCFAAILSSSSDPVSPTTVATALRFRVGVMMNFSPNASDNFSSSYPMWVTISPYRERRTLTDSVGAVVDDR